MMRIITGSARGTKLLTDEGTDTRPTTERVKEAVFSMIQFDIEGRRVLDLFAGSGQLGLEALSRGASFAVFCDASKRAFSVITANANKTKLDAKSCILCEDYKRVIAMSAGNGEKFDIVFIDPPYKSKLVSKALRALIDSGVLKSTSLIICETDGAEDALFGEDAELEGKFKIIRQAKYSVSYITLMSPAE